VADAEIYYRLVPLDDMGEPVSRSRGIRGFGYAYLILTVVPNGVACCVHKRRSTVKGKGYISDRITAHVEVEAPSINLAPHNQTSDQ